MSGNEFGERIHNFFGQDNLSQDQHQSQVGDGTWPGFSNGLLVGSQRQIGSPLVSDLKHYGTQQTVDSERGQSSNAQHGFNFTQPAIRPAFSSTHSQNHQPNINGYMRGNQVFQRTQNEADFLGVDTDSDRHRLASKGVPPDLQKNSMRLEMSESPVNYDFFGNQQQINRQFVGTLQSLPRQQAGFHDMQLLQQQVMLKQMQDFQRQQQHQKQQLVQLEAREMSALNHVAVNGNMMNGFPIHDASNNSWQPEVMTANTNWLQCGVSSVVQGSSSGLMFSPEQGQVNLMASTPRHFEPSHYGGPISSTKGFANTFSSIQMPQSDNRFPASQHAAFSNQDSKQDNFLLSKSGYLEKLVSSHTPVEASNNGPNLENNQQVDPHLRNNSACEIGRGQDVVGPSKKPHEKVINIVSSQNVAALDPTEEKILYGSDDNLWAAFGSSTNMSSGHSMSGGSDMFSPFPSLQSGSWSALMQSAVAETSSVDTGRQNWSGNCHPPTVHDSGKQQPSWADNKMVQTDSPLNSRLFPPSDNTNTGVTSPSVLGSQQSGFKTSNTQSERLHIDASQTVVQKFPDEGTKCLDHSLLEKPVPHVQITGNISHTSSVGFNLKGVSCADQPNVSAYNSAEQRSILPEGKGGRHGVWKADLHSTSAVPVEHKNSSTGFPQIHRESSESMRATAVYDSGRFREKQENSQQHPNGHNTNSANNSASQPNSMESVVPEAYLHNLNKGSQIRHPSAVDSLSKAAVDIHEVGNFTKKKSSNSFRTSISPQTSTGGLRDGICPNASESNTLPGGKQKPSAHASRRPPITRKFQYHPMGNIDVDEEPSQREKVLHSQPVFQQASGGNQRHSGQSKGLGQMARNPEIDKGHLFQGDSKHTNEVPNKGMLPDCRTGASASDVNVDNYCRANAASSSQNMLELFHKVDQSQEHGSGAQSSSSDHNMFLGMPEEKTYDGSDVHHQHNHSSASQGFNLQLAPPSQRLLASDCVLSSKNSEHVINSSNSIQMASDIGRKNQSALAIRASVQSLPHRELPQETFNVHGVSGQTSNSATQHDVHGDPSSFISGFSYSKGYPQNQQTTVAREQITAGQSFNSSSMRFSSQPKRRDESGGRAKNSQSAPFSSPDTSKHDQAYCVDSSQQNSSIYNDTRDPAQAFPVLEEMPASQPSVSSTIFQQDPSLNTKMSNSWANIHSSNNPEGSFSENDKAGQKTMNMLQLQGKDIAAHHPSVASSLIPRMAQSDFQTSSRSLIPNNISNEKDSLIHQGLILRNAEVDPANRSVKRVKGPDGVSDPQQPASRASLQSSSGSECLFRDGSSSHTKASGDSRMLGFLSKMGVDQHKKAFAHEDFPFNENVSQRSLSGSLTTSVGIGCPQISPQMAPSWFNQYVSFKNGPVMPLSDPQRSTSLKLVEQSLISAGSEDLHSSQALKQVNAVDSSHPGNVPQSSGTMSRAPEPFSSVQSLPHGTADQNSDVIKPKKRKTATFGLASWDKEAVQGTQRFLAISDAEVEWARVTYRLAEKLEEEAELIEDGAPVTRSKRRLILTAQLMQQLLRPLPAAVTSSDASSNYENVAYAAGRAALGDACCMSASTRSDSLAPIDNANHLFNKHKTLERIGDPYMAKAMEEFINRAKRLENDFSRLGSGTSISDLRLEIQDLERFSVINRFAKFHARGLPDGAEASSSLGATMGSLKIYPQRYVTAFPMPRNVPDRVQCLSL